MLELEFVMNTVKTVFGLRRGGKERRDKASEMTKGVWDTMAPLHVSLQISRKATKPTRYLWKRVLVCKNQ